jgi:hypothetical protein
VAQACYIELVLFSTEAFYKTNEDRAEKPENLKFLTVIF